MIITQTPLRISFLGGNTDFPDFYKKYGGHVLSSAIDKYIYCIITERFDKKIYINWSKKEIVDQISEIEHELVREALKRVGVNGGVEITFLADIPSEGSGLGSSSSVLVGVLNALYHYISIIPSAEQLAREACDIEINVLGKPIGIQDQYIASYGGLRFFEFCKNGTVKQQIIDIGDGIRDDFDNQLMLFFTGRTRKSSSILKGVKENIGNKNKEQFLLQTKQLALKGYKALTKGRVEKLGELMDQGWKIKKQMSDGITNPEIDQMYQKALASGALGGKIAGAGGGGFMLLLVPSDKRSNVRKALAGFREMPFRLERDGSKVIFNVRRY